MKCTPNIRQKSKIWRCIFVSKFTNELKLEIVQYILEKNCSVEEASKTFCVDNLSIRKWLRKYEEHGIEGIIRSQIRYDGNFKVSVVEYMHTNHLSLFETAIKFNIGCHSVVAKWERIYYAEGPQALYEERRGRSKNMNSKPRKKKVSKETEKDLIAEVQQLRMENAYLKKLNALVQERVKRENKKK